jgi:hypothetical protein
MLLTLLLIPATLHSNDSIGHIDMNGVHYEKTDDISMDKEILEISPEKVQVRYFFKNHTDKDIRHHTDKDIRRTVLFPISLDQQYPEDNERIDPLYRWYANIEDATAHDRHDLGVRAENDGTKPLSFHVEQDARDHPEKRWPNEEIKKTS